MKKTLFKNTIYKALLSFANIVIPLLVGPYIVKLLNVELYGTYNKVYADFQFFLTFASFGIYTYGIREISKIRDNKEKVSKLLSNLFLLSLLSNIFVGLIYFIYARLISSGITYTLYLVMLIQIVGNIFYIEFVNEALENYQFITIKTLIIKILYMISLFIFVKKPDDVIIYSIIICLTVFLNNIVSFIYAKRRIKFDFQNISIRKYIKPLFLIFIITNIDLLYSQLDKIMLGKFINDVSVTMYYIPFYIVSTLASIPYAIVNVSIPRLSYLIENEGKESYEKTLKKSLSSLLFIIIPVCLGTAVLAKEVIYLYAGENYMDMVPTLIISCIIRIIISVETTMVHLVMYPNGQEKKIVKFSLTCGIINLIFNILLIIFKIFTPFTCMLTTGFVEIILSFVLYKYIKINLNINFQLFTKQNTMYLLLSLCFIPITILVKYLNLSFYSTIVIIIILCVSFYFGILLYKKDENLFLIINKFFGKLRKKQK